MLTILILIPLGLHIDQLITASSDCEQIYRTSKVWLNRPADAADVLAQYIVCARYVLEFVIADDLT